MKCSRCGHEKAGHDVSVAGGAFGVCFLCLWKLYLESLPEWAGFMADPAGSPALAARIRETFGVSD